MTRPNDAFESRLQSEVATPLAFDTGKSSPRIGKRQIGWIVFTSLVYIAASLQNIQVASFGGVSIKIIHVLILVLLVVGLVRGLRFPRTAKPLVWYLLFSVLWTTLPYLWLGFSGLYFNYVFAIGAFFAFASLYQTIDYSVVLNGVRVGAFGIVAYSALNVLRHGEQVAYSRTFDVTTGARAQIDGAIYAGGVNLEASWIMLASALFVRKPLLFIAYSVPALSIVLAVSSRAALIIWAVCLVAMIFHALKALWARIVALLAAPFFVLLGTEFLPAMRGLNVVQRFEVIGREPGSLGRERLWDGAWTLMGNDPVFGTGLGNGVSAAETATGATFGEDNFHNLYLGSLVEQGVVGLFILLIAGVFAYRYLAGRVEARVYLLAFAVTGLVEFRGGDAMFYVVMAMLAAPLLRTDRVLASAKTLPTLTPIKRRG